MKSFRFCGLFGKIAIEYTSFLMKNLGMYQTLLLILKIFTNKKERWYELKIKVVKF